MFKSLGYFFTFRCLEMYFYLQGCIKLMKSDNKDFYIIMKIIFQTNAFLLNFLFIKYSWKKIKSSTTVFNNGNIKKFLIRKFSFDITKINYILKYILKETSYFKL